MLQLFPMTAKGNTTENCPYVCILTYFIGLNIR